jgi:hypothetical protein
LAKEGDREDNAIEQYSIIRLRDMAAVDLLISNKKVDRNK